MPLFISDLTRSKEEILLDMINHDNGTDYQVGDFMFDHPEKVLGIIRNTSLKLYGVSSRVPVGDTVVYYRRPNITELPGRDRLAVWIEGMSSYSDLIPTINQTLNINLVEGDYVDEPLPHFDPQPRGAMVTIELVMTQDNPIYIGVLPVLIHN